jgi:hypothetical protein
MASGYAEALAGNPGPAHPRAKTVSATKLHNRSKPAKGESRLTDLESRCQAGTKALAPQWQARCRVRDFPAALAQL